LTQFRHIRLNKNRESIEFKGRGQGNPNIPRRNKQRHVEFLRRRFDQVFQEEDNQNTSASAFASKNGIYLEFEGQKDKDLMIYSLENIGQRIRLCNVKEENETTYATVFIPDDKTQYFLTKIQEYSEKNRNQKLINSIEDVHLALVNALWTDKVPISEEKTEFCEIWLSVYDKNKEKHAEVVSRFFETCDKLKIHYHDSFISFPERAVVSVTANKSDLAQILLHSGNIAEFRRKPVSTSFFIEENTRLEQEEWISDVLSRTEFVNGSNVSICILDSGVNNGHPLIEPMLNDKDMHTTFSDEQVQDISQDGHGTGMSGIATYYNLEEFLASSEHRTIHHHLESVRMFDTNNQHDERLYGDEISKAISLAEINNPNNQRVITMAVTANTDITADEKDFYKSKGNGEPTSWSAAIDSLALGNYESELPGISRLMIISAGNTTFEEIVNLDNYQDAVINHSVEDPGQSWNALTVGAYTEKIDHEDNHYSLYHPLVEKEGYSPFTSSSVSWSNDWPVKPDIVLEGGNLGVNIHDEEFKYTEMENYYLLTPSHNSQMLLKNFSSLGMTSSATAQASYMAANILHEYPNLWPETVRALLVHAAKWTDAMKKQVFGNKDIEKVNKTERRRLLRIVGYGVPSLDDALYSVENAVNMIIEDELQPFKKESSVKMNEMHLHEIPWPEELLLQLADTEVEVHITLSYFIDPSPGKIGWKDKYRYPGCRLAFDLNATNESKEDFIKRVNEKARDDDNEVWENQFKDASDRWFFGRDNRNTGSVHSDYWSGTAAELAENKYVAIYPQGGWWKNRTHLNFYDSKVRYSLIVSISTPEKEVELYSAITNIMSKIPQEITIEPRTN